MWGSAPTRSSRPYRGVDRRAAANEQDESLGPFIVTGASLLVAIAVFTLGPRLADGSNVIDLSLLRLQIDAAALAVAVLAGVLCLIRWRMTGDAPALWLGSALLVLGGGTITLDSLASTPDLAAVQDDLVALAHPASRIAVLYLVVRALRSPEVDARLRAVPVLLAAAGLTAALTLALQVVPGLSLLVASAGDPLVADAGFAPLGAVLLAAAWAGFGAVFGLRGVRTRRWLFAWFGLLFFALGFVELLHLMGPTVGGAWAASANVLRMLGVLCALVGATRELIRAYEDQQVHLLETMRREKTKEARLEAEHQALEELAHEARNALTAIEGATRTLEHYRDRLDDGTRIELTEAVSREIARLQTLVSPDRVRSTAGEFRLVDVVTAVVTAARSHGVTVHVDVPLEHTAHGRPAETGQVIQNLVENARRYAPGSPIYVRTEPAPSGAVLRVEDEGPGVPLDERQAVFDRGRRGSAGQATDGTGLGLYVSAQLMREQGGELWVDERRGGGASFALWLPSAPALAPSAEEIADEVEHALEGAQVTPLFRTGTPPDPDGGVVAGTREHDDHVGDHSGG